MTGHIQWTYCHGKYLGGVIQVEEIYDFSFFFFFFLDHWMKTSGKFDITSKTGPY